MHIPAPLRLIDPKEGTALLRLVPFYLERLHHHHERADFASRSFGLPFPFLKDTDPIDVVLRYGMSPDAITALGGGFEPNSSLGARSWWRWASYALTPFGWVAFPTPSFDNGRLTELTLQRHGTTPAENADVMRAWLVRELGAPTTPAPLWRFAWGEVAVYLEPRDGAAQMSVEWKGSIGLSSQ